MRGDGEDALECALQRLRHRERSRRDLDEHLRERGFSDVERAQALESLDRTGLVDDARFASARAEALARRHAGNALIAHELQHAGVPGELVEQALELLEPELARASAVVATRGATPRTARYLGAKGFSQEAISTAVAGIEADELG